MSGKRIIAWTLILALCPQCVAWGHTSGWDPGTPIQGVAYAAKPGELPAQESITVYVDEQVEF